MQFGVDGVDLALGVLQQFLNCGGDLGLQMILQHLALAGREQLPPLGNLRLKPEFKAIGSLGTVLIDNGDDKTIVGRLVHLALLA